MANMRQDAKHDTFPEDHDKAGEANHDNIILPIWFVMALFTVIHVMTLIAVFDHDSSISDLKHNFAEYIPCEETQVKIMDGDSFRCIDERDIVR